MREKKDKRDNFQKCIDYLKEINENVRKAREDLDDIRTWAVPLKEEK